jgi:hydrogenase/urease accessory protein HupE
MRGRWLFLLVCVLLGTRAQADELRPGYLELTQNTPTLWHMVWKAPIKAGLATQAHPALPRVCTATLPQQEVRGGNLVAVSTVTCSASIAGAKIGLSGLDNSFTDALVRIAPLGQPVQAARLTPAQPFAEIATEPDRTQVARTYFSLGVAHILTGYDHLLFVLSLVLLIRGGWRIAQAVTAFTVAHSITLVATTLHLIALPRQPVEVCIALSIVFLAVEIVKARPEAPRLSERIPWAVAFAFGLLHGFGFAGALAEIGLPDGEVPVALLTFNLGVEAGQLIIVAGGLMLLALAARFAQEKFRLARTLSAYAIGSIAAFWCIERALA